MYAPLDNSFFSSNKFSTTEKNKSKVFEMEITITEKAREMLENKLGQEEFLRVLITEGGCAGLTYDAEIANEKAESDMVVMESGNVRIVADEKSRKFLDGLTVDYSDDLIGGGLRFTNSHAKSTCGCGASFNLSGFPVVETGNCGK